MIVDRGTAAIVVATGLSVAAVAGGFAAHHDSDDQSMKPRNDSDRLAHGAVGNLVLAPAAVAGVSVE